METQARHRFFGPRDNFPLSAEDFDRACEVCDQMVELRNGRAAYLEAQGLDEQLYLPAHMWGKPFVHSNFDKVARKDYHTINHLRCLTYNFTGYSMLTMANCEGAPEVLEVPANADEIIRGVSARAANAAIDFTHCTRGLPRERIVDTPRMFGESGWEVDGTIVNYDTWSNQQRINGLLGSGVLEWLERRRAKRGRLRVVEIGAGFGNLCYSLQRMIGPIEYVIVDLPESMIYSAIWLGTVLEGPTRILRPGGSPSIAVPASRQPGVSFVPNHLLEECMGAIGDVDLVINMLSLSEMSAEQVAYYGDWAREWIGEDGLFFEQNYIQPGVHTDILNVLGRQFGYGAQVEETTPGHRGRGIARTWANRYRGELWNGGSFTPFQTAAPSRVDTYGATRGGRGVATARPAPLIAPGG